jgi:hypothetical protein
MINRQKFWRYAAGAAVWVALGTNEARAEYVFDNTYRYSDAWYSSHNEFGDDALLSGKARTISDFALEYFGEFNFTGAAGARIRFYAPDGPGLSPKTLLYESEFIPIYPDYNLIHLRNLSVRVDDAFIWTVQFEGLSGVYQDRAEIVNYDPPALGSSYNDFWAKRDGQWGTLVFENVVANFAVRILGQPDPPVEIASETASPGGGRQLLITGPNFQGGEVWVSEDQTQWQLLDSFNFLGEPVPVLDSSARTGANRYYRANLATAPVLHLDYLLPNQADPQQRVIRVSGTPGRSFTLETSLNLRDWMPLPQEPQYLTSGIFDMVNPPGAGLRYLFYRGAWMDDLPVVLGYPSLIAINRLQFLVSGPPGQDCLVQASSDLAQWNTVATNSFSFTARVFTYVSAPLTNSASAYYRAVRGP